MPEKIKGIENEDFSEVTLEIIEPQMDKGFEISFETDLKSLSTVYNRAISEVCKNLHAFHQTGNGNEPGYHAWEMWAETDADQLKDLLPLIHQKAKELHIEHKRLFNK